MTDLKPPVAATRPHSFTRHGVTVEAPWAWIKVAAVALSLVARG